MKKYPLFLLAICLWTFNHAQIIYTDITDMVLTASPTPGTDYDLDIDGNSVKDFKVNMRGDVANAGYGNFVNGSFSSMNGALEEAVWGDALYLITGDTIGSSSLTWTDFSSELPVTIFVGGASYGQEWLVPVTDGYFGFKFEISGSLHYGWMLMDVDDATVEITIKEWAYNATPDEMIIAGQTTLPGAGIQENNENINLYFSNDQIIIKDVSMHYSDYSIFDLSGKSVQSGTLQNEVKSIDILNLTNGVYIISLSGVNGVVNQKITIL
jgi:hypothetical protein